MDGSGNFLKEVDSTFLLFTDQNGRLMNLSVGKHWMKDVFHNGIGADGCYIPGFADVAHSNRILMDHPPPSKRFTL